MPVDAGKDVLSMSRNTATGSCSVEWRRRDYLPKLGHRNNILLSGAIQRLPVRNISNGSQDLSSSKGDMEVVELKRNICG